MDFPTITETFARLEDAKAWKSDSEAKLNAGEDVLPAKAQRYSIDQAIADYLAYGDVEASGKRYMLGKLAEEEKDAPPLQLRRIEEIQHWHSSQTVLRPENLPRLAQQIPQIPISIPLPNR